jgi:hypothetical protein
MRKPEIQDARTINIHNFGELKGSASVVWKKSVTKTKDVNIHLRGDLAMFSKFEVLVFIPLAYRNERAQLPFLETGPVHLLLV